MNKTFFSFIVNKVKTAMLLNFLIIFCFANALAQKGTGKLTGKISDAGTNEPLGSVSVSAKGTKYGTTSITDGTYTLTVPVGTYTIRFSYSGYKTKEITGAIIKEGESTFLNMLMEVSTKQLEGVVVTATIRREAQSAVYSAQKRSSAVSDGISQEAIRRTPDNNAAQVLTRVTGINVQDNRFVVVRGLADQYNQTVVNGVTMTSTETNRNAFSFDLIPASVIDNIVVNKTATPDMPGNFAGGVVQVNTKDFPDNNFFSINLQGGFSDATIGKNFISDVHGKNEWLSFGGDFRDLPKDFPVVTSQTQLTDLNYQEQLRRIGELKNTLIRKDYGKTTPNEQIQLGFGRTFRLSNGNQFGIVAAINQRSSKIIEQETVVRRPTFAIGDQPASDSLIGFGFYSGNTRYNYFSALGGALNLAYKFGSNKVSLKNIYTTNFRNQYIERRVFYDESFDIPGDVSTAFLPGVALFTEQKGIVNSTLAGEHRTGRSNETRIEWNLSYTTNRTNTPDSRNFVLTYTPSTNTYATNMNATLEQSLGGLSRSWSKANDKIYGGAFNVTSPFMLFNNKQLFKTGLLIQNRQRHSTGTVLPTTASAHSIDSLLAPGNFQVSLAQGAFASGGGNYDAAASLLAAYESIENRLGSKMRLIWGIRLEDYQQSVNVYRVAYNSQFTNPNFLPVKIAARTTFNFLPSLNYVYSPIQSVNFRAAFSRTVIRPELRDLAPYSSYDFVSFVQTQGNQDLKSSSITNYDLKFEWFPSAGEILSFAGFYKKIKDPIEYAVSTGDRNDVRYAYNTGDAYVKGLELEIRKKLNFLPFAPWLKNVLLFGNGSLIKSKVSGKEINSFVLSSFAEHTLSGQANYIINAGATISMFKENFETTLSFNRTGDYINELGTSDLDVYLPNGKKIPLNPHFRVNPRNNLDLVAGIFFLKRKAQIRFKVTNLLKQDFILYQDLNGNNRYDGPISVNVGLKPDQTAQYSAQNNRGTGTDNTASRIIGQRTYSFSIAYTF